MRIFVQVVKRGSFVRAAGSLQISPAKVSVFVGRLEDRLGVRLIDRSTRGATDAGAVYLAHCEHILAEIEEVNATLAGSSKKPGGRIRIDAPVTLTDRLLLPMLGEFCERYPQITFEWTHSEHLFDLGHQICDLMFRVGPLRDSSMIGVQVGSSRMVTAGAPAYLARHGEPKTPQELLHHNCLQFVDPHTGRSTEWTFEKNGETVSLRTQGSQAFNEGESRIAAAVLGYGLIHTTDVFVRELLLARRLKAVLSDWETRAQPILLVYPRNRHLPGRVRAFVDYFRERCPPGNEIQPPAEGGRPARAAKAMPA